MGSNKFEALEVRGVLILEVLLSPSISRMLSPRFGTRPRRARDRGRDRGVMRRRCAGVARALREEALDQGVEARGSGGGSREIGVV